MVITIWKIRFKREEEPGNCLLASYHVMGQLDNITNHDQHCIFNEPVIRIALYSVLLPLLINHSVWVMTENKNKDWSYVRTLIKVYLKATMIPLL